MSDAAKERVRSYIGMALLALPEDAHWKVRADLESAAGFWLDYVDVCAKKKRGKKSKRATGDTNEL